MPPGDSIHFLLNDVILDKMYGKKLGEKNAFLGVPSPSGGLHEGGIAMLLRVQSVVESFFLREASRVAYRTLKCISAKPAVRPQAGGQLLALC